MSVVDELREMLFEGDSNSIIEIDGKQLCLVRKDLLKSLLDTMESQEIVIEMNQRAIRILTGSIRREE